MCFWNIAAYIVIINDLLHLGSIRMEYKRDYALTEDRPERSERFFSRQ